MIACGSAARQHQFGDRDRRARPQGARVDARPDRIQRGEPVEESRILRARHGPRQRLGEVMVGVDQARQNNEIARVDDAVGLLRQFACRPHGGDRTAVDQHRAAGNLAFAVVERSHERCVA